MKTLSEQIRDVANRLEEIEFESIEKIEKPPRPTDQIANISKKSKYGHVIPSHGPDIHAMDFLTLMDDWEGRIEQFNDVKDERLKSDLRLWLEKLKNQIQ